MSLFSFEEQRRTFTNYGYALDPSTNGAAFNSIITNRSGTESGDGQGVPTSVEDLKSVFDLNRKSKASNVNSERKKESKGDVVEDPFEYKGPWRNYVDAKTTATPTEEQATIIAEYEKFKLANAKRRRGPGGGSGGDGDVAIADEEMDNIVEKSTLHFKEVDYLGRNFMHAPKDLDVNLESEDPPEQCYLPKKVIHSYTGHTKGVNKVQYLPKTAHIFLSCSMDSKVKVSVCVWWW